jgi:hypothetical protein
MCPIVLSGKAPHEGYSFEEFDRKFEAICNSHLEEGRALAFAFILYDFDHPEVAKVLRDSDYWNALDQISGRFLTVFSFDLTGKNARRLQSSFGNPRSVRRRLHDSTGFIGKRFGEEIKATMPSILFFQVSAGRVSNSHIVKLGADTVEEAFHEIRDALSVAVEAVHGVKLEFRSNTDEIFNLILTELKNRSTSFTVKRAVDWMGTVRDVIGKLTGFGSR